jgi:hypothetical protein
MAKDHLEVNMSFDEWMSAVRESLNALYTVPLAEPQFKLFDFSGCVQKSDGTVMYPYPGGRIAETRPSEGQIYIEWAIDGNPKFVYKYQNGIGDGWVDITATYRHPQAIKFVPFEFTPFEMAASVCECGNPKNPIGQGHSYWCKLFKQEF